MMGNPEKSIENCDTCQYYNLQCYNKKRKKDWKAYAITGGCPSYEKLVGPMEAIVPGKMSVAYENNVLTVYKGERQATTIDLTKTDAVGRQATLEPFLRWLVNQDEGLKESVEAVLWKLGDEIYESLKDPLVGR